MPTITDISDAVVAELNDASFSREFTAQRSYLPRFELPEMADLHVTVVPRGLEISTATRAGHQHDYRIDVAVQQKLLTGDAPEIDGLVGLTEEIADHFRGRTLEAPQAACVAVETEPVYVAEHMDEMRQFTSVITLTFRTWR